MRSASSGPLTALFVFAVLLGVPLLAIFGVPHFAPVVASPGEGPEVDFGPEWGVLQETSLHGPQSAFPADTSRFAEPSPGAPTSEPRFDGTWHDPFTSSSAPRAETPPWGDVRQAPDSPASAWEGTPTESSSASPPPGFSSVRANFEDGRAPEQPVLEPFAAAGSAVGTASEPNGKRVPGEFLRGQAAVDSSRPADDVPGVAADRERPPWWGSPLPQARGNALAATAGDRQGRNLAELGGAMPSRGPAAESRAAVIAADRFPDFSGQRPAAAPESPASVAAAEPARFPPSDGGQSAPPAALGIRQREPLTWGAAVDRLNQLGIRQFKLEPGQRDGFHFSCYFTPRDNPRVTHRFEAESAEPLQAVEDVLIQVEDWLRRQ